MTFIDTSGYCRGPGAGIEWGSASFPARTVFGCAPGRDGAGGDMVREGFFARFRHDRTGVEWEERIGETVERATASAPPDVTIEISATQAELGGRLEHVSRLMKDKGYRLRQVTPGSGTVWAASFMRRH